LAKSSPVKKVRFTVPEVWRKIVKKNERQGDALYDVLICNHAVLANDTPYRKGRSCPVCRVQVQKYADEHAAAEVRALPAKPAARPRRLPAKPVARPRRQRKMTGGRKVAGSRKAAGGRKVAGRRKIAA
jgi:hypothetical protein